MRARAIAPLLLFAAVAYADSAPYVTVYRDDTVSFQVRRDRITVTGDKLYRIWLRWLWAEPQQWKSQEETATVRVVDLDCNELRVRELAVLHKNRKGEIYDSEEVERPEQAPWKALGRDSGAGAAMARVCEFLPQMLAENDSRVTWLEKNAVPFRSIDPADEDFSDLEPLRAMLAGVRVVMLGEQTHGDGTTFLAKARLIRFLHEQLGFDVLAFESGLYDCAKAWDFLAAGEPARQAAPRGVFGIWTRSAQVQPLIDYLGQRAASDRPLELAGVDSQLTASASEELLTADLAAFLSGIDPKLAQGEDWNRVVRVIDYLASSMWELGIDPPPPPEEQAAFARTIEQWRSAIAACDRTPATVPWSGAFWRQFLASLRDVAEQAWRTDIDDRTRNPAVFTMRDVQMGRNLLWLARERYPNRKIIVWAATFHNARNLGTVHTDDPKYARLYPGVAPMGEVAWKELGSELYSLGFLSYEGEWAFPFARATPKPLPQPSAGSLEDLCARAGLTHALVDFRKAPGWLRTPLTAQMFGHVEMRADWTRVVDGVVFLRKMERSRKP